MTDRTALALAALVAAGALWAPDVPVVVGVAVAMVGVVWRRPALVVIGLALVVGGRAHDQGAALGEPLPGRVDGVATLVGDPEPQRFGVRVVLDHGGRRYVADVPVDRATELRSAGTGDHVVVQGRPSELVGAPTGWVRSRHLAGRLSVTRLQRGPPAAPWFAAANSVRRTLSAGALSFDPATRPLYLGMVIGDDRELSELRQHRFRSAGLTHLTAVSGQNVAFVLAVAGPLTSRSGRRGRMVLTLCLLVCMVLVTRADPSVLRASSMAALAVVALSSGRLAPARRVLCLTVAMLLVVDPLMVHSLGFQLSVAATAGLVLLAGPLEGRLPGPRWFRLPLAVTLSAQLATAPLLLAMNGAVSPASVPANLMAVPAAGAVMMLGVTVGAVAGVVAEPVALWLQFPARLLVGWIDAVARWGAAAPCSTLGPWRLGVVVVAVAVGLVLRHRRGSGGAGAPPAETSDGGFEVAGQGPASAWSRPVSLVAVAVVLAAVWPGPLRVGAQRPAEGITMTVGRCGGVVVRVSQASDERTALEGLQRRSVQRIDVLVVDAGRSASATAATVQEQWPVRRRIDLAQLTAAVDGDHDPMSDGAAGWSVGGVDVRVVGSVATIELSEGPCRLAP